MWEGNIIDFIEVASISQFGGQFFGINPVNVRLLGSTEEVCAISSECYGRDGSEDLTLSEDIHGLDGDFG